MTLYKYGGWGKRMSHGDAISKFKPITLSIVELCLAGGISKSAAQNSKDS